MRIGILTVALLLALATQAHAVDTATVIVSFNDEAAEARYLRRLCEDKQLAKEKIESATRDMQQAIELANARAPGWRERGNEARTQSSVAIAMFSQTAGDLRTAEDAIKAKRDRFPKGYDGCK